VYPEYGILRRSAQLATASKSMFTNAPHMSRPWPNATASLMYGKNFSLFSMYFGANSVPSFSLPTSFARSTILRCSSESRKPASPVWNQPSASFVYAVACGFL
jgi:hypothetical protein